MTTAMTATITRPRHPMEGRSLPVLGQVRRHGRLELLLVLPDGSKSLIPADWTDQGRQDEGAALEATATLGSLMDLLAASELVSALSARGRGEREQAARQSPCKEDSRAACAAQSAAGPGSGATPDTARPTSRERRRGGDQAAGPADRQSVLPGPHIGTGTADGGDRR